MDEPWSGRSRSTVAVGPFTSVEVELELERSPSPAERVPVEVLETAKGMPPAPLLSLGIQGIFAVVELLTHF